MANTKYRLIPEDYKEICGKKLYRIEALKDFSNIKAGDLGGYIESENNLSHDGYAWARDNACARDNARIGGDACVGGNACVRDNARVRDNAVVCNNAIIRDNARIGDKAMARDNAMIRDNAVIRGNAMICDTGCVEGDAWVYSNARIGDKARIRDNASWLIVGPIGSRDDFTTFFSGEDGIYVSCGCFYGSISEFEKAVEKTHAGTKHEKNYKLAIELAKSRIVTVEVGENEI